VNLKLRIDDSQFGIDDSQFRIEDFKLRINASKLRIDAVLADFGRIKPPVNVVNTYITTTYSRAGRVWGPRNNTHPTADRNPDVLAFGWEELAVKEPV